MRYLVVWRATLIEWSDSGDFKNLSRPRLRAASRSVDFRSAQQSIVLFDGRIPVQPPDGSEGGEAGKQEETRQQRSLNRPLHETREIVDHVGDECERQAVVARTAITAML